MVNNSGRGSHGPFSNSANDLGGMESADDVAGKRMVPGQAPGRIAAHLRLVVAQAQAGEILRKAFVKPFLSRGIVETQKQARKIVGDGSPAVLGGKIEHDVVAVFARQKKSGSGDGLALAERRHANVFLVRLQRDHIQRFRHLHFGLQEELAKDCRASVPDASWLRGPFFRPRR